MSKMTRFKAFLQVREFTRFGSVFAAAVLIFLLVEEYAEVLQRALAGIPLDLVPEFWLSTIFASLFLLSFLSRSLLLLFAYRKRPWLAESTWLLTWGGLALWFVATGYTQGGTYWGLAEEMECYDCTIAFEGVPWLSWLNRLLIAYLFFSPIGKLVELMLAQLRASVQNSSDLNSLG
ncbi:MAG: hypothetical protein J5I65_01905 [Aridibacter famidurans]|nr:hypothetical protein [Aridibacter famidurans]